MDYKLQDIDMQLWLSSSNKRINSFSFSILLVNKANLYLVLVSGSLKQIHLVLVLVN